MKMLSRWMLSFLLISATGTCFAQAINSGDIRGSVTDPSGALIPGVTISVLNFDTGVSNDYTTNDAGLYDTNSIVTGRYVLTFKKEGFEQLVRGPVTIEVGFTTVNAQLQVGSTLQKVEVSADVPLLKTESSEQSTTLEARSMEQLPQVAGGSGVSWENFMILLPGASGCTNGCSQGSSNPGQEVAINGNMPYTNILADGASTTLSHSQNANPAVFETVQELQVSTSSFSAQYGIGGAIVNQISKGGTNTFHGAAYDYFQNDDLTAQSYLFGAKAAPIPHLRFNNFGFAVGGPVLKKKLFFYFDYDQIVDHGNSTGTNSVPSVAMMGGDFSALSTTIYDPTTQTIGHDSKGNPYPIRKSFASEFGNGNKIPTTMFDKLAAQMQQFYPTPSNHIAGGLFVPGSIGSEGEPQSNFYASLLQSTPYRKYFGRLDYDISSSNRLTISDTQSDTPVIYPNDVSACPIGCQAGDVDNNNAQITDVWNISPTMVNEARIGFTDQMNFFADLALNKGYASKLGWQFAKADDFPAIQFINTYPFAWIDPSTNAVYKEFNWDPSDVVTMIKGKHILHFGGELLAYQNNSTAWGNVNAGTFQFSGQYTQEWLPDPKTGIAAPVAGTGMEYADFLLGYANNWTAAVAPEFGARFKSPQMFAQDDWKIRPNLTLNLGLRYQINHGWTEVHNNMDSFDPTVLNPATNTDGAYWFGTTHANGRTSLQANRFNIVQPRIGFAWARDAKTTIRGGFGLYSYEWSLDTYGGNNTSYGMGAEISSSGGYTDPTTGITPATKLDGTGTNFVTGAPLPFVAASTAPDSRNGQGGLGYVEYHTPVPRIAQWNVSVQRSLGTDLVTELSYVASHGANLSYPTDLNQVHPQYWSTNDTAFRPYPIFQSLSGSTNNAISNYHSLQASITKRMTHGLSMNFNYVWAHMLDDQDSSGWGSRAGPQDFQNGFNPSANYSNAAFDIRQAFKGYMVYELPFGKGKQFLNGSRALDEAVGGWQLAGTVFLQTGNPFSVYGNQANYSQAGTTFPNWNPGVSWKPAHQSILEWYNPAAFTEPAAGTWGDVRRNAIYGPGVNTFNFSLAKAFSIPYREGISIQFRADAQNVFNHPSFGTPQGGTAALGGAAGVGQPYTNASAINSVTVNGRNLQLALRVSF